VGTVELSWSIDGRTEAGACEALEAEAFGVLIFDERFFVLEHEAPCADFVTRLDLFVDDYIARTTLVDTADFLVTRRVIEDYFQISEGALTRLSMDFPSAAARPVTDAGAAAPSPDAGPGDAGAEELLP
jgi:hypothetical protein